MIEASFPSSRHYPSVVESFSWNAMVERVLPLTTISLAAEREMIIGMDDLKALQHSGPIIQKGSDYIQKQPQETRKNLARAASRIALGGVVRAVEKGLTTGVISLNDFRRDCNRFLGE